MKSLRQLLQQYRYEFESVLPPELQYGTHYIFDLSVEHNEFADIDFNDTDALIVRTKALMASKNAVIAIGRYAEVRGFYTQREHFANQEKLKQGLHIGMDLTVPIGTPIFAPMNARVHSFADNNETGDYGPTIILEHKLEDFTFYTLYGHLSRASLDSLTPGKIIKKKEQFATLGDQYENGDWPPNLHFQIIGDIEGYQGTYPGVADPQQKKVFLERCPDPNLILNISF